MNKIIFFVCIIATLFLVNIGFSISVQLKGLSSQIEDVLIQNKHIRQEIEERQLITPRAPKSISKAFNLVINEMRYLQNNSGTAMDLMIDKAQDNEDISSHYMPSEYRGVNKLEVLIRVNKFSIETDMVAVLNDIYQLEIGTDFKATELNKGGDSLIVKGEVYGI